VIPRIRATVLHSTRAGAALLSGGERETTMGRALQWSTRSMRASPMSSLIGTMTSGARWLVAAE